MHRIFEEFGQIDNPLQKRAKGVGLGLPLTRKLAHLLGGDVSVRSELRRRSRHSLRDYTSSFRAGAKPESRPRGIDRAVDRSAER